MNESTNPTSTVTIKKYANRRLYNTATSAYVTLEDLSAMVKDGIEFNVYDAKTSEDITRSVLTQIIVEEEGKSGQQNLLPISFLRQLIPFYGDNMQWMVPKYLEHSMQMLSQNQEQIKNYFQSAFGGMFPFGSTFEEMGKQNLAMFERTMNMFTKGTPLETSTQNTANSTKNNSASTTNNPMWNLANCFMTACAANNQTASSQQESSQKSTQSTATPAASSVQEATTNAPKSEAIPCSPPKATSTEAPSQNKQPTPAPLCDNVTTISAPSTTTIPMSNVKTATTNAPADDMQQKIANLQKQLADLAKNRA